MSAHAATFDAYYRTTDDPWGFRTRWYERRKRALLQAILPREHYESAWEMGCSNGELAAAFAPLCRKLLASDGNPVAVRAAKERLKEFPSIEVAQFWVPDHWPAETFDLIVLGEMAYYLDARLLQELCRRLIPTLRAGGHFAACHWRPPIEGCAITGDKAHEIMTESLSWKKIAHHREDDFVLDLWAEDGRSVAEKEGLR